MSRCGAEALFPATVAVRALLSFGPAWTLVQCCALNLRGAAFNVVSWRSSEAENTLPLRGAAGNVGACNASEQSLV
ncbi:hypothetical protein ACFQZR_11260 [Paenibacillus sp. GCM10027629]|uniref:hypothetical protein n=1 Tax=Paenibacillus sp. GCM10027629 TaxID=3273414 RepID=UPI00363C0BE4